jgi:hypothetical protein
MQNLPADGPILEASGRLLMGLFHLDLGVVTQQNVAIPGSRCLLYAPRHEVP